MKNTLPDMIYNLMSECSADIEHANAFIALSDNDEQNILACLMEHQ